MLPPPLIAHITPSFAPGGAQVRAVQLINHFGAAFRHLVLSLDGDTSAERRIGEGVDVRYPVCPKSSNPFAMVRRLSALLAAEKPDLVLTYNWGSIDGVMAAVLAGRIPVIHGEDGFGIDEAACQLSRRVWGRRALLRTAYRVVAPSRTLLDIMRDVWRLPSQKVEYIPNGIELNHFPEVRHEPKEDGEIIVGTVGHLRPEKRQDRLIAACAELATAVPVRLIVAGDGPERPRLEEMARSLGVLDRVSFLGHQADVRPVYQKMDIFALSSATEQMPLTVLEAMACGLPVVSTDVGDVRRMVSDENAPFITSERDFPAALHKLATDASLRTIIGRANRAHCARTHNISKMFERYAALYESAIAEKRPARAFSLA
jgi:glycosyltransferase involved in cell wall biosynthesis